MGGMLTWTGIHSGDASQEISSKGITTGSRGGVRAICSNHVVDGGHVDGVVRNSDEAREDQWGDPVDSWRAQAGPGKAEEADGQEWGGVE